MGLNVNAIIVILDPPIYLPAKFDEHILKMYSKNQNAEIM